MIDVIAASLIACVLTAPVESPPSASTRATARQDYELAATALRENDFARAAEHLQRLIENAPENELAPLAAAKLGSCYSKLDKPQETIKVLTAWQERIATSPRSTELAPDAMARTHLYLAAAYDRTEQHKLARDQWEGLARLASAPAQLRCTGTLKAAQHALTQKEYLKAGELLEWCEPSALSAAQWANIQCLHAKLAFVQNRSGEVLERLSGLDLSQLASNDEFDVQLLHSEAAIADRKYDLAKSLLVQLVVLADKEELRAYLPTLALRRCEVAMLQHRPQEAAELASKAQAAYPESEEAGELEIIQGRAAIANAEFITARTHFETVANSSTAERTSTAAKAAWFIGETYFLSRDYPTAIHAYSQVVDRFPTSQWAAAARLQRGKCFELTFAQAAAIADYQCILHDFPTTTWQAQATNRLNELGIGISLSR